MEICPKQNADTLLPTIQKHCLPGSMIHTDGWPAYCGLKSLGFDHAHVNHKAEFVAPDGTHTQRIEPSDGPCDANSTQVISDMMRPCGCYTQHLCLSAQQVAFKGLAAKRTTRGSTGRFWVPRGRWSGLRSESAESQF